MHAGVPHQLYCHDDGNGRGPGLQDHADPEGLAAAQGHVEDAGHEGEYDWNNRQYTMKTMKIRSLVFHIHLFIYSTTRSLGAYLPLSAALKFISHYL